jgi:hypothetical protein
MEYLSPVTSISWEICYVHVDLSAFWLILPVKL